METWPTDGRAQNGKATVWDYPCLQQGSVNAISLNEVNGRLEWTSIVDANKHGLRLSSRGHPLEVFPKTRPTPFVVPKAPVLRRAEQGAHFIRTHFPEVDIPSHLIREEIESETRFLRDLAVFDPLKGSIFESARCHAGFSNDIVSFLVFPMGELDNELNVSPVACGTDGRIQFEPIAAPSWTFSTPIYQIASNYSHHDTHNTCLAVRTATSTAVLAIQPALKEISSPGATLSSLFDIVRSDVGDRHVVDVKLTTESGAVVVNDSGGVYKCQFVNGGKNSQICKSPASEHSEGVLWRLACTSSSDGCLLSSERWLKRLDFRSLNCSLDLYAPRKPNELIVCPEGTQNDRMFRFVTTSDIVWVDERYPQKPLLAFQHGRQFDRTLGIQTALLSSPFTLLTSQKNGLVTVYDVSRASDQQRIHVNAWPYCLPSMSSSTGPNRGHVFVWHPYGLSAFQLSEHGSIRQMDLELSPTLSHSAVSACDNERCSWPEEIKELSAKATLSQTNAGSMQYQPFIQTDLTLVYAKICYELQGTSSEVGRFVRGMPLLWRQPNPQSKDFFTTFDFVFSCGPESKKSSRANFLTQGLFNCATDFRILSQSHPWTSRLIEGASWHHDFTRTFRHFYADVTQDFQGLFNSLSKYMLPPHRDEDGQLSALQSRACEVLAVDLALAADVFASHQYSAPNLSHDAPSIRFGYIRPSANHSDRADNDPTPESELSFPLGARHLLEEWEVGVDPSKYAYKDSGHFSLDSRSSARPNMSRSLSNETRQAPTIITTKSTLAPASRSDTQLFSLSQGVHSSLPTQQIVTTLSEAPESSQNLMTSTQPAQGRYGSRQSSGKLAKKRLGGF